MDGRERKIIENIRREWEDAVALFSNEGQDLQERLAVHGFLRVLGIEHSMSEIVKRGPEPIDVWFRDARFQVTETIDHGRRRNLEMKQRLMHARRVRKLRDLIEGDRATSRPVSPEELMSLLVERSSEKSRRYGGQVGGVDLLIYVNLRGRHLFPDGPFSDEPKFREAGWRSVSVVMEGVGAVMWASAAAPEFLREWENGVARWSKIGSIFT